jgi:hypothetical protein
MVTSWWPSKSIPNKNQNENVASFFQNLASFFQNLAIPLPHPLKEKSREYLTNYSIFIWESHLSFSSRHVRFIYL